MTTVVITENNAPYRLVELRSVDLSECNDLVAVQAKLVERFEAVVSLKQKTVTIPSDNGPIGMWTQTWDVLVAMAYAAELSGNTAECSITFGPQVITFKVW